MGNASEEPVCPICLLPSDLSCSSCKKVNYCSREHQKQHWKIHKPDCFPGIIEYSPTLGRYLVASRDIQQGEIILREKPLVSGPLGKEECFPVCLTCFKHVATNNQCSSCKWPVCGSRCEKDPSHANFECKIFRGRLNPISLAEASLYEKILILRGVMIRDRDAVLWAKIQALEDHAELRAEEHTSDLLLDTTFRFIREACGIDVDKKTVDHIIGSVIVNAFVSDDGLAAADSYRCGSYLYYYASMPAHDCRPNSSWVINSKCEFIIRASVPIKAGESITHLYAQPTMGTQERRQYLHNSKYFDCICKRCSDPTELGTYFSAIKCPVCPPGYLLMENPTSEEVSEWKCDHCNRKMPAEFAEEVISRIQANYLIGDDSDMKSINTLDKIIRSYSGKTVHPNHYCLHTIKNDMIQRMSFLLSTSTLELENERFEVAERMVTAVRQCLDIAEVIWPGYNRHRGRLLYFLQQGLFIIINRVVNQKRMKKLSTDKTDELKSQFQEYLDVRQQVYKILSIEPEGREESFIANLMTEEPPEINKIKVFLSL